MTLNRSDTGTSAQAKIEIRLPEKKKIRFVELKENIAEGQRIESFRLLNYGGCVFRGYTVGHRKLCPVNVETDCLTLFVTASRDTVDMREITVYGE